MSGIRRYLDGAGSTAWSAARGAWGTAFSSRLIAVIPGGGCAVLRYHSVNDDPTWGRDYVAPAIVVRPEDFESQLALLRERCEVVPLDRIVDAMAKGRRPDPRWVAITFDDGYEDNYRHAYRLLREYDMPATFYVTTACVDDAEILWTVRLRHALMTTGHQQIACPSATPGPIDLSTSCARHCAIRWITGLVKHCARSEADEVLAEVFDACEPLPALIARRIMMNAAELQEMEEAGMAIGGHSVHHYNLPVLGDADLRAEVCGSRAFLVDELGLRARHFAYPNGRRDRHCDARVAREIARCGYRSAATSISGPAGPGHSRYGIPRVGVSAKRTSMRSFAAHLQHGRLTRPRSPSLKDIERNGPRDGSAGEEACE